MIYSDLFVDKSLDQTIIIKEGDETVINVHD